MIFQTSFYRTTVGKKITMAVTGAVLFLFLVGHLLGNLQVFAGAEKLNAYAAFLKKNAGLVWTVRAVMMACLVLHVVAAWQVVQLNRRARTVAYTSKQNLASTYASRTMQVTGPLVLLYVVYHLMMFTWLKGGSREGSARRLRERRRRVPAAAHRPRETRRRVPAHRALGDGPPAGPHRRMGGRRYVRARRLGAPPPGGDPSCRGSRSATTSPWDCRGADLPPPGAGAEPAREAAPFWDAVADDLRGPLGRNRSTLIFANSKHMVEKLTRLLNRDEPGEVVYSHHGALSREVRQVVEERLKRGELRGIVATNSLELGIDVGSLDEVVLAQTPPSFASAALRIGRAGHEDKVSRPAVYILHGPWRVVEQVAPFALAMV